MANLVRDIFEDPRGANSDESKDSDSYETQCIHACYSYVAVFNWCISSMTVEFSFSVDATYCIIQYSSTVH